MTAEPKRCDWTGESCPTTCPIPSVDNFGKPYPGCALVRLKSLKEIEAMLKEGP
jgi:hypothetical protein